MTIGAIGAVGGTQSVYAALSPYLNGVVRTSNAAQLAQIDAAAQRADVAVAQAAIAANGSAAAAATAAPPFANPAISAIAARIALAQSLTPPAGATPDALLSSQTLISPNAPAAPQSPANELTGDSGTIIQANAAALFASSLIPLQASAFAQAIVPAIPPPAIVTAAPRLRAVA
jgi:hypothetical protein